MIDKLLHCKLCDKTPKIVGVNRCDDTIEATIKCDCGVSVTRTWERKADGTVYGETVGEAWNRLMEIH